MRTGGILGNVRIHLNVINECYISIINVICEINCELGTQIPVSVS